MFVLLLAGGKGRRFSTERPKQFTRLLDRPVFAHSLGTFQQSGCVEGVGLIIPKGFQGLVEDLLDEIDCDPPEFLVTGGERRRDSVWMGLDRIDSGRFPIVAVHDAARPNIGPEFVRELNVQFQQLSDEFAGLVPGFRPDDTVKKVQSAGIEDPEPVERTLDRSELRLIQTPQIFRTEVLKNVHKNWEAGVSVTDDASMLERAGHGVAIGPGRRINQKLTHPGDQESLEWLIQRRENGRE